MSQRCTSPISRRPVIPMLFNRPARLGAPAELAGERSEALGGTVATRGLGGNGDLPIAAGTGRRDIEIGLGEVENALGIAELEVNPAVAHVDGRGRANHRGI